MTYSKSSNSNFQRFDRLTRKEPGQKYKDTIGSMHTDVVLQAFKEITIPVFSYPEVT